MPSQDLDFIQIEADEDANTVRDRLSFIRGRRVLLVWPEEGTALTRKLDLVLIQREAMRRAIRLAIVTHDTGVIQNARELNISTFETIGASERGRWKRGRTKVFTNRQQRPKDEPDHEELQPIASRIRIQRRTLSRLQNLVLRLGVLAALLGTVLGVAYIIIPEARITLVPAAEWVEVSAEITVNPDPNFTDVDVENAILPAILLQTTVEETATVNTTGTQNLGDERAVGSVVFINRTGQPVEIPAGTVVSTSAGTPILFRTTQAATLAAGDGQQIEVGIEAMPGSEGSIGNVAENMINAVTGPLENGVTVRNLLPTSGGQPRIAQQVMQADYDLVTGYARQQLQDRAYTGMAASPELGETQFIIIETLRIVEERADWTTYSANVNDLADTLSVTMRATLQALAVDEQIAQQIIFARMAGEIPRGRVLAPESIEYQREAVTFVDDRIQFTFTGRGLVTGQISTSQIQQQLAGRSLESAVDYLVNRVDIAENTSPVIRLTPGWFNRMPVLPMRIIVDLHEPGSLRNP